MRVGNKEAKCLCGDIENMLHIYNCEYLNQNETQIPYNEIFNGNLESQKEIFRRMETNLEKRNEKLNNLHAIPVIL